MKEIDIDKWIEQEAEKIRHQKYCIGYDNMDISPICADLFEAGAKAMYEKLKQGEWISVKPKNDKEFILITANYFSPLHDEKNNGYWEYTLWEVTKVEGEKGWYYGLCCADGEEWGPYEDLQAELYLVMPKLPQPPITQP